MSQLIVKTPNNPDYNEKTLGVQFNDGAALVNEHTGPNRYGYTLDQLAVMFGKDLPGYTVMYTDDAGKPIDLTALAMRLGRKTPEVLPEQVMITPVPDYDSTHAPYKGKK